MSVQSGHVWQAAEIADKEFPVLKKWAVFMGYIFEAV